MIIIVRTLGRMRSSRRLCLHSNSSPNTSSLVMLKKSTTISFVISISKVTSSTRPKDTQRWTKLVAKSMTWQCAPSPSNKRKSTPNSSYTWYNWSRRCRSCAHGKSTRSGRTWTSMKLRRVSMRILMSACSIYRRIIMTCLHLPSIYDGSTLMTFTPVCSSKVIWNRLFWLRFSAPTYGESKKW